MSTPRIPKSGETVESSIPLQESQGSSVPSQSFASLMQKDSMGANTDSLISPFELAQMKPNLIPDPHSLIAQMQIAQNSMEKIQSQIQHPDLKLKPSQKYLIKNKLKSANESIHAVASKMSGTIFDSGNIETQEDHPKGTGPISQFMDYLTDGLAELESTKRQAALLGKKPSLSPADFLLMQVKLNKATQELEFTNSLLGSVIGSFKQIMNIQL